ncbi:oligosaccharide flippase family protein [Deinococcus roseus]|uniref:oligosaccharide flippase family protein n=1 Tax=Deinococcus roseus TaxID=392414 RepID=UPI00227D6F07|nr:oligosaccharide flippase family protein [Deinococcus roseus]
MLALFGTRVVSLIVPLITIPFLARALHPEEFGKAIAAQSFGILLSVLVEYGFNISATREIAVSRENKPRMTETLQHVYGAKTMLSVVGGLVFMLVGMNYKVFGGDICYPIFSVLYGIALGCYPIWFFQGIDRLPRFSMIELTSKIVAGFLIILLARTFGTGLLVIIIYALSSVVTLVISSLLIMREGFVFSLKPDLRHTLSALKLGWQMFIFRASVSLYSTVTPLILGTIVNPSAVALYGNADKVNRLSLEGFSALTAIVFPRVSRLLQEDAPAARNAVRKILDVGILLGLLIAVVIWFFAPEIIHLILGEKYHSAVPVLRILALSIPFLVMSNILGLQWMIANGHDRQFNSIIISASVLNMILIYPVAFYWSLKGAAFLSVTTEIFIVICMVSYVSQKSISLWRRAQ